MLLWIACCALYVSFLMKDILKINVLHMLKRVQKNRQCEFRVFDPLQSFNLCYLSKCQRLHAKMQKATGAFQKTQQKYKTAFYIHC